MVLTEDPTTVIESQGTGFVVYRCSDGRRWRIEGTCNACGACESPGEAHVNVRVLPDGTRETWTRTLRWHGDPGEPGACEEIDFASRKDIPMTPDAVALWAPYCTLTGVWLE